MTWLHRWYPSADRWKRSDAKKSGGGAPGMVTHVAPGCAAQI
jgi:hypothetical protein